MAKSKTKKVVLERDFLVVVADTDEGDDFDYGGWVIKSFTNLEDADKYVRAGDFKDYLSTPDTEIQIVQTVGRYLPSKVRVFTKV